MLLEAINDRIGWALYRWHTMRRRRYLRDLNFMQITLASSVVAGWQAGRSWVDLEVHPQYAGMWLVILGDLRAPAEMREILAGHAAAYGMSSNRPRHWPH